MTYLQMFTKITIAKALCHSHIIECNVCPYSIMGDNCYEKLEHDMECFQKALSHLGAMPVELED